MAERIKIQGAAAKIQALVGTDSVPTFASNAIRLLNIPTLQINYLEDGDRADEQHAGMGTIGVRLTPGAGARSTSCSPSRAAAPTTQSAPTNRSGIRSCARPDSRPCPAVPARVRSCTPISTPERSKRLSLYLQSANKLFKMIDCIVLPKWSLEAAKKGAFTFTVIGASSRTQLKMRWARRRSRP
jgi:hypothetical protein